MYFDVLWLLPGGVLQPEWGRSGAEWDGVGRSYLPHWLPKLSLRAVPPVGVLFRLPHARPPGGRRIIDGTIFANVFDTMFDITLAIIVGSIYLIVVGNFLEGLRRMMRRHSNVKDSSGLFPAQVTGLIAFSLL